MAKRRRSGAREAFWQSAVRRTVRPGVLPRRASERGVVLCLAEDSQAASAGIAAVGVRAAAVGSAGRARSNSSITIELRGARRAFAESMTTERLIALLRGLEAGEATS